MPGGHGGIKSVAALEVTQGQIDGLLSQLTYKCHLEEVPSVGDLLKICPQVGSRVAWFLKGTRYRQVEQELARTEGKALVHFKVLSHRTYELNCLSQGDSPTNPSI